MDAAAVSDWLGAGHEIGSHTCTHRWLTRIPVEQAREEFGASRGTEAEPRLDRPGSAQ